MSEKTKTKKMLFRTVSIINHDVHICNVCIYIYIYIYMYKKQDIDM